MQRSESLKKNQDFQKVYKHGTSKGNRYLVMYVLKNQYMKNRLGISVSKKVGNSVVRHRLTRLIRGRYASWNRWTGQGLYSSNDRRIEEQ